MTKTRAVATQLVDGPDGQTVDVRFMADGSIHIDLSPGPWGITHFWVGPKKNRVVLRPTQFPQDVAGRV